MNHPEQLLAIAPLTLFQAIIGSMPVVTQELAGRGDPCHGTHPQLTATQAGKYRTNPTIDVVRVRLGVVGTA